MKKSGCIQFMADKAVDFVAHGFPAGSAEMERHLIGGVADFLHQGHNSYLFNAFQFLLI